MSFRTPLGVSHEAGEDWVLSHPLVFQGRDDFYVIRSGFRTNFASVPRPARWLFDSAGVNSEAGVLHDALWRETKRTDVASRVDPWDADGLFRRALRQAGATLITRWLMWLAVRAVASLSGRLGAKGPPVVAKVLQLAGLLVLGLAAVGIPTVVVLLGRVVYWVFEWATSLPALVLRREVNLPWPKGPSRPRPEASPEERLLIIRVEDPAGVRLAALLGDGDDTVLTEADLDSLGDDALAMAY